MGRRAYPRSRLRCAFQFIPLALLIAHCLDKRLVVSFFDRKGLALADVADAGQPLGTKRQLDKVISAATIVKSKSIVRSLCNSTLVIRGRSFCASFRRAARPC